MTTRIVEFMLPFHEGEGVNQGMVKNVIHNNNTHSIPSNFDLDGFLNQDYLDNLNSGSIGSQVPQTKTQGFDISTQRDEPCNPYSFDELNASIFPDEEDYLSPYTNGFGSFPESPSVEDLRSKLGNLQKPSMTGQKQEKEEDNEEESSSSSSSDDADKKQPNNQDYMLHPVKKSRVGIHKNDSCSSISSYSSGASSDDDADEDEEDEDDEHREQEEEFDEFDDDDEESEEDPSSSPRAKKSNPVPPKKYKHPSSHPANDLIIGNWSLSKLRKSEPDITLDVKILFGRRKIKYEINFPLNKSSKNKTTWSMDFPFQCITALDFKTTDQKLILQLSERPTFSIKEKGKCSRCADFTDNCASTYQRHHLTVENGVDFTALMDCLLGCDRRLRKLAKLGTSPVETTFPTQPKAVGIPPCDWDKDNKASKHCQECKANYCDVCDDVLHRHESQKTHRRVPVQLMVRPAQSNHYKAKKPGNKKRKKMNNDRCRCGTGATKGTLGEPCTGNRCPCFSSGKSCVNCGCKGCANPLKLRNSKAE